ncbi:hypothetical protein EUX98_g7088 [Antrodiella citrinella]|uniref:Uncharacterized protein n=1 Tax=Antrodiella citrinella TaxID=2447956 RepID=A0A4S4MPD9_9APHY|nr:hypothetical protein EUX98_g7088 [Antrodiella citrinella]
MFLESHPKFCNRTVTLRVDGGLTLPRLGKQSTAWVSSLPLLLPSLPKLRRFTISNLDLRDQHLHFYQAIQGFSVAMECLELELEYISAYNFSQIARLILMVRASSITLVLSMEEWDSLVSNFAPPNPWIKKMHLFLSTAHASKIPWKGGKSKIIITPETIKTDDWRRFRALFQRMRSKSARPLQVVIESGWCASLKITEAIAYPYSTVLRILMPLMMLTGQRNDTAELAATIAAVLRMPEIIRFRFQMIIIDFEGSFSRFTSAEAETWREKWKGVDEVLLRHTHLLAFRMLLPDPVRDYTKCTNAFKNALFPLSMAKGIMSDICYDRGCSATHKVKRDTFITNSSYLPIGYIVNALFRLFVPDVVSRIIEHAPALSRAHSSYFVMSPYADPATEYMASPKILKISRSPFHLVIVLRTSYRHEKQKLLALLRSWDGLISVKSKNLSEDEYCRL